MEHECIRFVDDIGMFSFSRGRSTCDFKTKWCERHCYANKFYSMGWSREDWDKLDDEWWQKTGCEEFVEEVMRCASPRMVDDELVPPDRFRFAIKGEIWVNFDDVCKVRGICDILPETLFWIPTRAWWDPFMQDAIEEMVLSLPNARVMASVDPTVSASTIEELRETGWSILYVTKSNEEQGQLVLREHGLEENVTKGMFRCPKTWEKKLGHCGTCEQGCFSAERVEVQLKYHR